MPSARCAATSMALKFKFKTKEEIPADLVTASGSGLDPDLSPAAAYVQVKRIAVVRGIAEDKIRSLVDQHIDKTILGPSVVNVLKLNITLDNLNKNK